VNTPTFQVQLDRRDPVQTTSTDQSFSGLTPGTHTVSVELVDANGTPINGSHTQIQFTVGPAQPTTAAPVQRGNPPSASQVPHLLGVSFQQDSSASQQDSAARHQDNKNDNTDDTLPQSGSILPLMSLIGFGVLVGGITSALKTR
jgi:Flp pilus assembly protein TadG